MKIRYIDGNRFTRAIIAGGSRIFDRQDYLNKINVFPIPDCDAGSNMASTMRAVIESISDLSLSSVSELSTTVAESALSGARGNSGVILAQYFYGLAHEIGDEIKLSTERFGNAVKNAVHYAYEALTNPKEGTILTVIKDWAENVYNYRYRRTDFVELFDYALTAAKQSLEKTTEKLEVLKSSGVVDAGAQGFVYLLEGITHFISKGRIKDLKNIVSPKIREVAHTDIVADDIKYQYCTECLIMGDNIDLKYLRKRINHLGESIVLAGSPQKASLLSLSLFKIDNSSLNS